MKPPFRCLSVIAVLLSASAFAKRAEPLRPVQFVGCPSDGQLGPKAGPRSGKVPSIPASVAGRLAWYSDGEGTGVLAPRGWHCVALWGSDGGFVIVTPELHKSADFLGDKPAVRGPAVLYGYNFGGTSGRWAVVDAISRYFPRYDGFIRKVRSMDLIIDAVPTHPYPADLIRRRTDRLVRLTTPAGRIGQGTHWLLVPDNRPVESIRELIRPATEPDLISVDVRLSAADADLTPYIFARAE